MNIDDIKEAGRTWCIKEAEAGKSVDFDRFSEQLRIMVNHHNNSPRNEFNGLSPAELHEMIHNPFSEGSAVVINKLTVEQYESIPLVKQALFLLHALVGKELKLTKLGWLPLKVVAEAYHLGLPEPTVEMFDLKRINEYDAKSVGTARIILERLGWIKTRKGMLSLTVKGNKALADIDYASGEILRCALTGMITHGFDGAEDERIGNIGIAYSAWLLNKYGSEWHTGRFYQVHYQRVFDFPDDYNIYATRVFTRLFYWLGIAEIRPREQPNVLDNTEYRKTDLLPLIFSFKNSE